MRLSPVLLLLAALAVPADAQVKQVPNSGCPGAVFPTHNGIAKIGQQFQFSYSCTPISRQAIAILGTDQPSGLSFDVPFMCSPGPCNFHPSPVAGQYYTFPNFGANANWVLDIPNDAGLVGSSWSIQCMCYCG